VLVNPKRFPVRTQEKTLAQALRGAGYATAHFGKTNFFDRDPLMSRMGQFVQFEGDSSEVIVDEALEFIRKAAQGPFLVVIWYGTPHSPFRAGEEDKESFQDLDEKSQDHY